MSQRYRDEVYEKEGVGAPSFLVTATRAGIEGPTSSTPTSTFAARCATPSTSGESAFVLAVEGTERDCSATGGTRDSSYAGASLATAGAFFACRAFALASSVLAIECFAMTDRTLGESFTSKLVTLSFGAATITARFIHRRLHMLTVYLHL